MPSEAGGTHSRHVLREALCTEDFGLSVAVDGALLWLRRFLFHSPAPRVPNANAATSAHMVGTHLLHLLDGCRCLNSQGYHSVALLRSLEDALDCFVALCTVEGAAERWLKDRLKASDAARDWVSVHGESLQYVVADAVEAPATLSEYRRRLRAQFNEYSHCSHNLCAWNLFFSRLRWDGATGALLGLLELNLRPIPIPLNAHAIDVHLAAHL